MKDLIWDRTLSVEVEEIDDDHRRLVDLFNILNHALEDGESADYVEAVLTELINCTVWHFSHEERLMLKHGFDDTEEHKTEHGDLIESVKSLQQRFREEGKQLSADDIAFLERWLTEHILDADMKMGAYLAGEM